jgi:hypothetical protein
MPLNHFTATRNGPVQTVDELAIAVQDGFARRHQADLVRHTPGSSVVGMDEGDEGVHAKVCARMTQHDADGFAGDAAPPMGPHQAQVTAVQFGRWQRPRPHWPRKPGRSRHSIAEL